MAWWRDRIATGTEVAPRAAHGCYAPMAGFTLLELLIVMAVLGILAGIVVFSLQGVGSSATVAACQSDFATTTEAVTAYQAQMGGYPGGTGSATVTDSDLGTAPGFTPGAAPSGVNAARAGGELLVSGATAPNLGGTDSDGPLAQRGAGKPGQATRIWVANDGSGIVQVLDAAGQVPAGATHTAEDCSCRLGWRRRHDHNDRGADDNDELPLLRRQRRHHRAADDNHHRAPNDDNDDERTNDDPTTAPQQPGAQIHQRR